MNTIQITIDEVLLGEVDRLIAELGINRSTFFRDAAQRKIRRHRIAALEEQHRRGYEIQPQTQDEMHEWLPEQDWEKN